MYSTLIRWSGLAAVAAGILFIIATLMNLAFAFGLAESAGGSPFLLIVGVSSSVFLVVGVFGLYARLLETMGFLGLAGFLALFVGLLAGQLGAVWSSLLTNLGLVLLGTIILLRARTYPRTAALLLIIGAALAVVVNALAILGFISSIPTVYVVSALGVATIITGVGIAWLGLALFRERGFIDPEGTTANNDIDLEEEGLVSRRRQRRPGWRG